MQVPAFSFPKEKRISIRLPRTTVKNKMDIKHGERKRTR